MILSIFSYVLEPVYFLLGEVSVQVLCPFFNWIVCLPGVESCEFFIYFRDQTFVWGTICKYIFPYKWFLFIFLMFSLSVENLFILNFFLLKRTGLLKWTTRGRKHWKWGSGEAGPRRFGPCWLRYAFGFYSVVMRNHWSAVSSERIHLIYSFKCSFQLLFQAHQFQKADMEERWLDVG